MDSKRGFTLIELLIVIAILGILAAGVLVAIDPIDKINAAKDSKLQSDVRVLAVALESYAASHNGQYPPGVHDEVQDVLIASGDLKVKLKPPSGYITCAGGVNNSQYYVVYNAGEDRAYADCTLKSKKYTSKFATPHFIWCSDSGKADVTGGSCP